MKPEEQLTLQEYIAARKNQFDALAIEYERLTKKDPENYPEKRSALSWQGFEVRFFEPLVSPRELFGELKAPKPQA